MLRYMLRVATINNRFILRQTEPIRFTKKSFAKLQTYLASGLRIAKGSLQKEKPLLGDEQSIIKQIHHIRYNENNPYVITGGHFSPLFVRNMGIFFNALLDPRIPSSKTDWEQRQKIALKTVAFALENFRLAEKEYTTITHVENNLFTGLNLYARPSDSLHAIVYSLNALTNPEFITETFPSSKDSIHQLQTQDAGNELLIKYTALLNHLLQTYQDELIDPQTKLIKKELLLSSARDGIKRQSSFYDNVILWNTLRLATKLKINTVSNTELAAYRKHIIKTFWNHELGIFLDDLSGKKLFSADSFIVLSAGFLDPTNKTEKAYLLQMIEYVKKHQLDQPFPLHYSTVDLPNLLYRPVRYFAPSYMGTSIWSHWGMEYLKTLLTLSSENPTFLSDVQKHLATYKQNIETYGGYPEVYDAKGKLLHTRLYRSVLHNGWVINYEQVRMLYKAIRSKDL